MPRTKSRTRSKKLLPPIPDHDDPSCYGPPPSVLPHGNIINATIRHLLPLFRQGRFVLEDRRCGKSTALLMYAHELLTESQTVRKVTILTHNQVSAIHLAKMWREIFPGAPISKVIFTSSLQTLRGINPSPTIHPKLVDEFLLHPELHSLPDWAGIRFQAGVSSHKFSSYQQLIW